MQFVIQSLVDAIALGSLYALIALGISLIFGIMGLINIAHGELMMLAGYALLVTGHRAGPVLILIAIATAVVGALAMERVAFRPVRHASLETMLVTSFAVSFFLQSLVLLSMGARPRSMPLFDAATGFLRLGGIRVGILQIVTLVTGVVLLGGMAFLLRRSMLGIQMRAAADDFGMLRLLGVSANRVVAMAFCTSGVLAGVAGILIIMQRGIISPQMGLAPVVVGIVAVVIGGMRSLVGAVVGGYVLGGITVLLTVMLPAGVQPYRDALVFASVIALLLFRPAGLVAAGTGGERV